MIKKALFVIVTMAFLSTSAMAGDRPEFDGVGDDSNNWFNCLAEDLVIAANPWNTASAFLRESFTPPAKETGDLCFPGYMSAYTQWHKRAQYKYRIVLQMDPSTDLDINIRDCVTKHNSTTIFGDAPNDGAFQTGRGVDWLGFPGFYPGTNPYVTVMAYPGPYAVFGFNAPFYLTNREQGGLDENDFVEVPYTSKALWQESLVARMPEYEVPAPQNGMEYNLSAGDIIEVVIDIPATGVTDVRYGADNVTVKYVGVTGTVYTP